jgi:hypothetical protein
VVGNLAVRVVTAVFVGDCRRGCRLYPCGAGVGGVNNGISERIFDGSNEGRVEGCTVSWATCVGPSIGRFGDGNSVLDDSKEGKSDGISDLGDVGEDEGATVGASEGLFETA